MDTNKLILHEQDFSILHDAIVLKLISKLMEDGISIHEDKAKTTIWDRMKNEDDTYMLHYLKEIAMDKQDVTTQKEFLGLLGVGKGKTRHLYDHNRVFSLARKGVQIEIWLLNLYAKFLGYKSYQEFSDKNNRDKITKEEKNNNLADIEQVKLVVKSFYDFLSLKKFENAWSLLSHNFQNRDFWKGDISKFELGYINFRGVKNCAVFNATYRSDSTIECLVYYEDEVERHVINDITIFENMTIDDIDEFVERIRKLQEKITTSGGKHFKNTPLQKMFDPTVSEYIWYVNGFTPEFFKELYPMKKTIWVKRLYVCTCVKIEDNWVIDRIVQDKTYTSG